VSRYISVDRYVQVFCIGMAVDADVRHRIETTLDLAAGHIDGVRASVGADTCTVSTSVSHMLEQVNAIYAAVVWNCPCSRSIEGAAKDRLMEWATNICDSIANGSLEVCEGETGVNFPAAAMPKVAWNDAVAAEIYLNYLQASE